MAENMNENGGLNTGMDLSSYMVTAKADKEETCPWNPESGNATDV